MNLTKEDYINILNYYNIKINSNTSLSSIKKMVEKIIAQKLCSCIKKHNTIVQSRTQRRIMKDDFHNCSM